MFNLLLVFPEGKEKALTLSYDDGVDTDIRMIELMEKYQIKCTFNISAGLFSDENAVRGENQIHFRLSKSRAEELYRHPLCEVATHGYVHPHLNGLPDSVVMCEIINDRCVLENIFGKIIRGHAYPFGEYNDRAVDCLKKAGIAYARTTQKNHSFKLPTEWLRWDPTCSHGDPMFSELVNKFIDGKVNKTENGWLFFLWGHTYEFRRDHNWDLIEAFFQKVACREEIWLATNIEVYDYITAWRSLIYSVNGEMVYNPTCTDVWVKMITLPGEPAKIISVPAGEKVSLI